MLLHIGIEKGAEYSLEYKAIMILKLRGSKV
jgi:hypothetical protein